MAVNKVDKFIMNDLVFVPDEEEGFIPATIAVDFSRGEEGQVRLPTRDFFVRTVSKKESMHIEKMDPQSYQDVPDLIQLKLLNTASLLYNLRIRYCEKEEIEIYTNIGSILVAINPFTDLGLYTQPYEDKYLNAGNELADLPPHIFKVAEAAFINMNVENKDQSCVITGESGAGKTETTKRFLQYISEKSKRNRDAAGIDFGLDTEALRQQILDSNPFMEAFGNAKTLRNDNSSRFGKLIEMFFDTSTGVVIGAQITSYLLEKSRVVKVSEGERSYHIFYQLCAASGQDSDLRRKFHLQPADSFNYTLGDNKSLADIVIPGENDSAILEETKQAMRKLGVNDDEIETTFRICSAVLHIGNIDFEGSAKDLAEMKEGVAETAVRAAAELLAVDETTLEKAILERSLRGDDVKRHTVQEAEAARDALSKFVYEKLFDWLIGKMNSAMSTKNKGKLKGHLRVLGVLDIFGFETFAINSFEQMCINFCNERLQGFFNYHIFKKEQIDYRKEGINFHNIGFSDNQGVIDLFEKGNTAIMTMCDDACSLEASKDQDLLRRILDEASERSAKDAHTKYLFKPKIQDIRKHKHLATAFCVKHYAGHIHYNIEGFLEKNKDQLRKDLKSCLASSDCELIQSFFPGGGDLDGNNQNNLKTTLSYKFRNSLNRLMRRLNGTTPQFVRCIKPNEAKRPGEFDHRKIYKQLNEAGLLEVCRIRKLGYPIRKPHREFVNDYLCIDRTARNLEELEAKLVDRGILYQTNNSNNWQIGKTMVFLRSDQLYELERQRSEALKETLRIIQGFTKKFLFRVKVKKALKALKRIQIGMSERKPELLQQGLDFFLEKGPLFGKLPVVIDGMMVMKDLQGELDLVQELQEAMEKQDYNTIKVKVKLAEEMKFEHDSVEKAKVMLEEYEVYKQVVKKLQDGMASQDVSSLEAAVKFAEEKEKTEFEIYDRAVVMLKNMQEKEARMTALRNELNNENLDIEELGRLIQDLKDAGVSIDHPLLVEAARKGDLIIEREKKREKKVHNLESQFKRSMRKRNLRKLKELVKAAVQLKYNGELVGEAMELITHLEHRQELLDEVSYAYRVLKEKTKLSDGITETDLKPLLHAMKVASEVPGLELESEIQVVEGQRLIEKAKEQITTQKEVAVALDTSSTKSYYKMLEKVQTLGLQTREADALVQKVREIEILQARAEALTNREAIKQNRLNLVVPTRNQRIRHLVDRIGNMNDANFREYFKRICQSTELAFANYFRLRGDADYLSREKKRVKAERKAFKFAYEHDRPLTKSLLELDDLQEVIAIQINKTIHKYCSALGKKKDTQEAAMSFIVEHGIVDPYLADEIYLQLAKHVTGNGDRISRMNAWHIICLCTTYFPATNQFLPYFLYFLRTILGQVGLEGNFARYAVIQLSASRTYDPLLVNFKPGAREIAGFFEMQPIMLQLETADMAGYTNIPIPPDLSLRRAAPLIQKGTGIKLNPASSDWAVYLKTFYIPPKRTYKERLEIFYRHYKPENLGSIDQILAQYKGREEQLFETLVEMEGYGEEPQVKQHYSLNQDSKRKDKNNMDAGEEDEDDDSKSVGSMLSTASFRSAMSNVSRRVSRVFRKIRGLSTVDVKELDNPTPRVAWPLPWFSSVGVIANNVFGRNLIPRFYLRRRLLTRKNKLDSSLFFQLKSTYRSGFLVFGPDTVLADYTAVLLCEYLMRRRRKILFGNKEKLLKAGLEVFIPVTVQDSSYYDKEWLDSFAEVVADRTLNYENFTAEQLRQQFYEMSLQQETYGKVIFFANLLTANTSSYIARARSSLDAGLVSVFVSPKEVSFYDEDRVKTASFKLSDLKSFKTEGTNIILTVRSTLKQGKDLAKNDKRKSSKPRKSLRFLANPLKNKISNLLGTTTKIQLYSHQRTEVTALLRFYKDLSPDRRQ